MIRTGLIEDTFWNLYNAIKTQCCIKIAYKYLRMILVVFLVGRTIWNVYRVTCCPNIQETSSYWRFLNYCEAPSISINWSNIIILLYGMFNFNQLSKHYQSIREYCTLRFVLKHFFQYPELFAMFQYSANIAVAIFD